MARSRRGRDANAISTPHRNNINTVHSSATPTLSGPGFTSPQRVLRAPSQPMADARRYVPPTARPVVVRYSGIQRAQTRLQDKRTPPGKAFKPVGFSLQRARGGVVTRKQKPYVAPSFLSEYLEHKGREIRTFVQPHQLVLCKARKIRKRVLHALKIAGGRVGRPHYNERSEFGC